MVLVARHVLSRSPPKLRPGGRLLKSLRAANLAKEPSFTACSTPEASIGCCASAVLTFFAAGQMMMTKRLLPLLLVEAGTSFPFLAAGWSSFSQHHPSPSRPRQNAHQIVCDRRGKEGPTYTLWKPVKQIVLHEADDVENQTSKHIYILL